VSAQLTTVQERRSAPAAIRWALSSDSVRLALLVALVCAVLAVLEPSFLGDYNAYVLLRGVAVTLIVAYAQMLVLAIGQLSLSVGAIGGMTAVLTGGMMERWGTSALIAVVAGLLIGALAGVVNGLLITRTGINGFVITLATASAFTGVTIGLNNAVPFYNLPPAFVAFGQARLGPIPAIGVVTILVTAALAFLFRRTVLGRQILAVGGNTRSAALSGIRVDPIIVVTHTISGLLSAIAGILLMARLGSAQPSIGSDWLLPSFAIPIVGGVALNGGASPIIPTVLAACLIALIDNGLVLAKADPYWIQFLLGVIILGAVGLNTLRRGPGASSPVGMGGHSA
jgi:ribose transport system permease protein